uniref:Uncharacterized protein n=1 Tax=Anguilla anguilla TaxID=7936 RepID=A0A0E9QP87_ANGAN
MSAFRLQQEGTDCRIVNQPHLPLQQSLVLHYHTEIKE